MKILPFTLSGLILGIAAASATPALAQAGAPGASAAPAAAALPSLGDSDTEVKPWWRSRDGHGNFQLNDPGYFDVGGGVGHIIHTNSQAQASTGFLLTLKAYPWGRWYSSKKAPTAKQIALDLATKSPADAGKALEDYLSNQTALYSVADQNHWYNRISVFYGRSFGNFDPSTIRGNLDAIGMEYDIVPEFAFMVGEAFYEINLPNNGFDTKHHIIFGIQMNLNAFSAFRNLGGGS